MNDDLFPEEWLQLYMLLIYNEAITTHALSTEYHFKVARELEKAVATGYGGKFDDFVFGTPEYETAVKLRESIYSFSAAKQYQQVRTMSKFIVADDGIKSTFKDFTTLADKVFTEYNKNYLKTEYNTAIGQGQNAREWTRAVKEKKTFPVLEYRTQRDSHVRDEHAILHGIKRPVTDPFWNTYHPKNGWNCRCFVVQHEQTEVTDLTKMDLSALNDEKKFPPVFRMNLGKDGIIFNPKSHPYFKVAHGDGGFKKENFGLPK